VAVTFAPKYPGPRNGAVVLQDQTGKAVATAYLAGTGTGPMAGFQIQANSTIMFPGNIIFPTRGVAVDGAGDIFVGSYEQATGQESMQEVPTGCVQASCVKTLPGTYGGVWALAVDGAGNVFVADVAAGGVVTEILASGGYTTTKSLTGTFGQLQGVTVDGSGNVFLSDFSDGAIKEMTAASGYATTTTVANGFQRPGGVAVDGSGDVFLTDGANVKEIVAVNGSIPASPTIKILGSGLSNPIALVLDGSGNILVIDSNVNHNGLYEMLASSGYTTVNQVANGFTAPSGLAIDSSSNLYVVDSYADDGFGLGGFFLDILPRNSAAGISFPTPAPPGSVENGGFSDTLTNLGTAPLNVSGLTFSSANFKTDPTINTCTASIVLAPGATCVLGVEFTPQAVGGSINGTLTVTDNSQNAAGSTQPIALFGQALYTPVVTVASVPNIALAQTLTVTITVAAAGGNPTPTGTVQLNTGTTLSNPTALVNGSATFMLPAASLVPGAVPPGAGVVANITMAGIYSPDAPASAYYFGSTGLASVTVTSTALITPAVTVTPQLPTVASTQPVTLTATVVGGSGNPVPTGSVTATSNAYVSSAVTLVNGSANILIPGGALAIGTDAVNVTYVPDAAGSNTYLPASGSDWVTVTAPPPPVSPVTPGFGSLPIGQTSAVTPVTLTFAGSTTIGSVMAMTQGSPGLDFALAPGGTCTVGASFSSGQSCTVNVTFSPKYAGLRNGGIVALDASSTLQAEAFVHGTGTGPQVVFFNEPYYYESEGFSSNNPASDILIGDGFSHPGATVDGAGNVFIADEGNNAIKEIPAGCIQDSCQKVLMSGLASPWAVAVDGAGNLFVASLGYNSVLEIPIGCQTLSCLVQVGSGFNQPYGVSLDSSDNVFVADGGNSAIKEVLAASGYTTTNTLVSGLNDPWSVVVDANENLFVGEGGNECQVFLVLSCNPINTLLVEIPAANDYSQTNVLGSGIFGKPMGLAIDGSGNVFVGDFGDQCPFEFLVGNGYTGAARLCTIDFLEDEESIGVEGNENLILPNVLTGVVEKLDFADPPALTFGSPALVGELDNADGERAFSVQNQGNAPLTFTSITLSNPSFQIDPAISTCSVAKPLAPGGNCLLSVFFEPTTTGLQNAALTLTDDNLNVNAVTQVIQISGDSVPPPPTILTMPANPTGTNSATFTFSDAQANVTFECSIDGLAFSACTSGVVYSPLSAGQHSFQVRALDADNFLSQASVYSWTVTGTVVTPPTITSGPGHITSATTATFTFTDSQAGATFLCSLDGAAFTACTSGVSYSGLTVPAKAFLGIHTFAVEAEVGGSISQPASYEITVTLDTVDVASTDFGAVPVGQTSAPITVNFAFDQFLVIPAGGDTIATIDATTLGVTGLDYAVSNPGTCAVGTALTKTSTCSMQVTFKPSFAGQRKGAIILLDPSGNGIGEAYLNGTGTAPQVTFTPSTPVNFTILPPQNNANPGKDLQTVATDSTIDGAGNLYAMDDFIGSVDGTVAQSVGDVWKFAPGCTTPACSKLFATSGAANNPLTLDLALGITMDGAGMIFTGGFYLGGGSESTVGTWTPPDCGSGIELGINGMEQQPAVDGWGQVYYIGSGILNLCGGQLGTVGTAVARGRGHLTGTAPDAKAKQAAKVKPQAGGNTGSFDFSGTADSLTIDPQGNIWVADSGNNAIKEVLASSGYAISQVVGSGFNNPESVASDSFGNIFVNDAGNGAIKEMTASSGYATILTVATIPVNTTFTNDNIMVDAQGNVYWPNQGASSLGLGVVEKFDFSDAPAIVFPTATKVGTTDAVDGTMTATLNNSGNAPLTISGVAIAGNSFQIDSGKTTCSASTTLAVGGSCTVGVFFSPDAAGALTGTLTITDNALNASAATQTFALSGTGFITPTTAQPTVTVTPAANSINTSQTLSVTITVAGKNPTPVPTGVVTLSTPTYNSATTTLTGGTATITIPAGALAAGSDTLTAIYGPDQASSTTYGDGAGFATVTVTAGTKSTPTVTVTPSPATVTIAQDFSVMVTVAAAAGNPTPTGTVTLLSGGFSSGQVVLSNGSATIPVPARTLAAGTDTLTVNYGPDTTSAANYNNATGTATETVQPIAKTAPALVVTPNPNNVLSNQALTVTVALNGGLGKPSPSGTVTLSGGGFTSAAVTLSGGSASIPISGGLLSLGTDTLTANYTPDVAGAQTYTSATGSNVVTVTTEVADSLTITGPLQIGSNYTDFGNAPGGPYTPAPGYGTFTVTQSTGDYLSDGIVVGATGSIQSLNEGTGAVTLPAPFLTFNGAASAIQFVATSLPAGATAGPFTLTQVGTSVTATFQVIGTLVNTSNNAQVANLTLNFVTIFPNTTVSALFTTLPLDGIYNAPAANAPTVTVTPSPASITTAQALTVTATVSGGSGNPTPTGTVTLTSGSYTSAAVTLSSGSATINVPAGSLAAGTDTLTVAYTPDAASAATYASATGTSSVTVSLAQTSTALIASALNPASGTSVTFTATVTENPGSAVPTGTVTFMDGAKSLGTGTLNGSGVATFTTSTLAIGPNSITAVYGGDSNNAGSTSAAVTVTVSLAQTSTALMASALNPASGTSVTFTATVTENPGSGVPTGPASFMDGSTTLGMGTLNGSGVATYSTTTLALGANSITAVYGGDANNAGSTSAAVTVTVTAAQVLTATLTPNPLTFTGVVGTTSAAQTATLTNTGNTALSITGISLTGTDPSDFAETNACPDSLAPQQTCTISVTFTPASAASLTATLSVADNATGAPQTVTLNGTGSPAPSFTISSPTGPQTIAAGGSATYTITVTPQNGSYNNAVTFAVSGLPAGATGTFQPTSVTPGSSPASSTLTIQTGTVQTAATKIGWPLAAPALAALGLFFIPGKRRRRWITMAVLLLGAFGAVTAMTGCGGGFALPMTPAQSYTVTVTATSGTVQQTTTVQLTVQ
jgi:large repetitive protein